jgi:hypothetical protein
MSQDMHEEIYERYQHMLEQLKQHSQCDETCSVNADSVSIDADVATGVGENMALRATERPGATRPDGIRPCAIGQSSTDSFVGATLPYAHEAVLQYSISSDWRYDDVPDGAYVSKTQRQREAADRIDSDAYAALGLKSFIYELVCATLVILIGVAVSTLGLALWRPDVLQRWIGGMQ